MMSEDRKSETSPAEAGTGAAARRPGEKEDDYRDRMALASRMGRIGHKVMVLSGKGGVGKSTVAVKLAAGLALAGKRVGLLVVDIHGPSIPKLLHLEDARVSGDGTSITPVRMPFGPGMLHVMSIGLLLQGRDDAVIWRGPRKYGVIKQFLTDVDWGTLDFLVIDAPPGTGDEPLSVAQLVEKADGAVIVTTPQELAVQDVRRCIVFCRTLGLPVLGVVENMSGFTCPKCGEQVPVFGSGGGRRMAEDMGVPYLGAIPIEPQVVVSGDSGFPIVREHPHSETAHAFGRIVRSLLEPDLPSKEASAKAPKGVPLRIAVPVSQGRLAAHFGHCEEFVVFDVDRDGKGITGRQQITPPVHEPGVLPRWLHEQGANVIIAGGMGSRAQSLFAENQIGVVVGAADEEPEQVVRSYLDGSLKTGANACDH